MPRITITRIAFHSTLLMLLALSSGCAGLKAQIEEQNAEIEALEAERATLREELEALTQAERALSQAEGALQQSVRERENLTELLRERDALHQRCIENYQALQQTYDVRDSERAELEERVENLRRLQDEAERRQELYEDIVERFRSLIDSGQLQVTNERGRLVLNLPQDILFRPGRAEVGDDGEDALSEIATVLADLTDRRFQVEGHTDNVPISTSRFPSNWELSAARAMSVVKLLVEGGMAPEQLSGAGYGEYAPRASNESAEGRALNRRIEIVLLPDLDAISNSALPTADEEQGEATGDQTTAPDDSNDEADSGQSETESTPDREDNTGEGFEPEGATAR